MERYAYHLNTCTFFRSQHWSSEKEL